MANVDTAAKSPTVLFIWDGGNAEEWKAFMEAFLGEFDFRVFPDVGNPDDIDYVMTWLPPIGEIKKFKNLNAIFSIGAGVSHILRDPDVPQHIPLVRLTDEALTRDMTLYAVHWVLHYHRGFNRYLDQQKSSTWKRHAYPANEDRRVGVLGLGQIGSELARMLQSMGFDVAGWSRTPKKIEGVTCLAGPDGLEQILQRSEILVSVLPPTKDTNNLLNRARLSSMQRGSFLINMGRGEVFVDEDLLALLNDGHIAGAALDVFRQEPLPSSDPFWAHPSVIVTPHAAGPTSVKYGAKRIAENILKVEAGEPPHPIYSRELGY